MSRSQLLENAEGAFGGRYGIIKELGSGGFGAVYEALQTSTGQRVALKMLRFDPDISPEEQRTRNARFVREVAACARLSHPHIVRLLDGGVTLDGAPFACFSLVPGCDLRTLLSKEGVLPVAECMRLLGQILDALAWAHEADVVHRDLKPANIMVSKSGVLSYATILDFGVGALLDQLNTGARLTVQGGFIGTPNYSAPEQLRGAPPTPRSDLYAWGLVFLECLTGRPAVSGATPAEISNKQCSSEPIPIPPSLADHPLGKLLAAVTEKDVEKRVMTAREAVRQLAQMDISGVRPPVSSNAETVEIESEVSLCEGERRQITALVCDYEFAAEGRSLTLDELALAIAWLDHKVLALAQRLGAHMGDSVGNRSLFLFGYPRSNENDAFRAVQAAQSILAFKGDFPDRLRAANVHATVRIGIDTGLAILRPRRDNGDSLVVVAPPMLSAGELADRAKPEGILIGEASAEIVKSRFEILRQPASSQAAAVAFSVEGQRPCATLAPDTSSQSMRPLVGRQHEMAQLRERWQQCLAGSGKAILIKGEAGVGKSRLARELLLEASASGSCAEMICTVENQTRPFHPLIELLNRLIDPTGDAEPQARLARLEDVLRSHGMRQPDGVRLVASLLCLETKDGKADFDVSPDRLREQTIETLVDLLFGLPGQSPLLLLVEDVQWADASTMAVLEKLVGCASESRLLILMTARKEIRPIPSAVWQLDLEPLTCAGVKAMLEHLLTAPFSDSLAEEVAARTGGICLFIEELGNSIVAASARADLPASGIIDHLPELLIPLRLRDLLAMRLDDVGDARAVAQLASVIGREFGLDLLAAVSPLSEERLLRALRVLIDADLIRERRRSAACIYAFRHALIRDAAYDGLVMSARQSAHAAIADVLARNASMAEQRPELIAYHLARAGRYRSAIEYAIKAASSALMRSANEEARSIALEAEQWLAQIDEGEDRSQIELALDAVALPALMACWRWTDPAVRQRAERSLELLKATEASAEQARILWALGFYYMVLADREKCRAVAEQQLALADQLSDRGMRAAALNSLSGTLLDEGQFREALAVADSALELFDPVHHANHVYIYGLHTGSLARMFRALAMCHLGRFRESVAEAELAEHDSSAARHSASQVLAVFYRALLQTLLEDRSKTHSTCQVGIELALKSGHPAQLGYFACLDAWATGDLTAMRKNVGGLVQLGQGLGLPFYQSLLAEVEAENGHRDLALEITRRSIAQSRSTGNISYLSVSLADEATYLLALDERQEERAEALLREAMATARSQGALLQELKVAARLARTLLAAAKHTEACALLTDCCRQVSSEPAFPIVDRARALLIPCHTTTPPSAAPS
jgi:TOMM system kinase/cyclase fusion protein